MKHFGDITKLNGAELPIVDIITGGSPCQDLSVAGKRAGLAGERSGLFMEQIRIIKEMRNESTKQLSMRGATFDRRCVRPRYMVWENVPGAFSSNQGEDFRCVLEETARIADKDAVIPRPPKGGRWTNSGAILGDGWSIAWRLHDAQFWGVPQRRKRIALVADFGGESAPEILFEREGVSRNTEPSREAGEEAPRTIGNGIDKAISFQERAGCAGGGKGILIQDEHTGALRNFQQSVCYDVAGTFYDAYQHHGYRQNGTCTTLTAGQNMGVRGDTPLVVEKGAITFSDTASARLADDGSHGVHSQMLNNPEDNFVLQPSVCLGVDAYNQTTSREVAMPIRSKNADTDHIPCVTYSQDAYAKYSENTRSASIKQSGGDYGGGSEALVIQ